jgi:hemolysin D
MTTRERVAGATRAFDVSLDPLLSIVLKGEDLIVEATLLNKDVGFVYEGQSAQVTLEALSFTRYGIVNGTVERIGHDAVDNKELGMVFPSFVKLAQSFVEVGSQRVALVPGFAATAEIRTGDQRIIEFLLSPLSRRMQEAGRER